MSYDRIRAILESCEMLEYLPAFMQQAYDDSLISEITAEILQKELGISVGGHRVRIVKAIRQYSANLARKGPVAVAPVNAPQARPATFISISQEDSSREVSITANVTTIGRHAENAVVIEDTTVSGRHAEIHFEGGKFYLVDLDSSNGTELNGVKVSKSALSDGDSFSCGSVKCTFKFRAPAPAEKAPLKKFKPVVVKSFSASSLATVVLVVLGVLLGGFYFLDREAPLKKTVLKILSDETVAAITSSETDPAESLPTFDTSAESTSQPTQQEATSQPGAASDAVSNTVQEPASTAEPVPQPQAIETPQPQTNDAPVQNPANAQPLVEPLFSDTTPAPTPAALEQKPENSTAPVVEPLVLQETSAPRHQAVQLPEAPPKGMILANMWDSRMAGGSQTLEDLQGLLGGHAKAQCDLAPQNITIYNGVKYLMPLIEALDVLNLNRALKPKALSPCAAFPNNSFYMYSIDGAFEDRFNKMYLVVDGADQVVAVQLVDETPPQQQQSGELRWHTYNFVQQKEKAKNSLLISHEIASQESCVIINTLLIDPGRLSRANQLATRSSGIPLERVRLYLPQPVADLILLRISKVKS